MEIEEKLLKFRQTSNQNESKTVNEASKLDKFFSLINTKRQVAAEVNAPINADIKPKPEKLSENILKYPKKPQRRLSSSDNVAENNIESVETTSETSNDDNNFSLKIYIFKLLLKFLLWAVLFTIFIRFEFGLVYFIVSLLVIIYLNTNTFKKKKGHLSAYSVFNPNVERIHGTVTAEQLQNNMVGGGFL